MSAFKINHCFRLIENKWYRQTLENQAFLSAVGLESSRCREVEIYEECAMMKNSIVKFYWGFNGSQHFLFFILLPLGLSHFTE